MTAPPDLDLVLDEAASTHFVQPWVTEDSLPASATAQAPDDVDLGFCIAAASNLLFILSGRQFRSGRSVVRPTSIESAYGTQSYLYPYSSMSGYGAAWGFAAGWSWTAIGMGWWQNGQDLSECLLQGPVRRINRVLVDGNDLGQWPPTNPNYTLYGGRRLVRNVDATGQASGAWPWNQQLQLPPTMPGTWLIDYEWGLPPPPEGQLACQVLALELRRSLGQDPSGGKLPDRVLSLASEGVTVAVGDPLAYLRESLTGLPAVDLFLQAHNPTGRRRRAAFLAPNTVQGREMTGYPRS